MCDASPESSSPLTVCPCPSNVPPKVGIGTNFDPLRSTSLSRYTVFPCEYVSSLQLLLSCTKSSAE